MNSKSLFSFAAKSVIPLLAAFSLMGCEEEKKSEEALPELPPIEIPEGVPALYSGRLPCDDCTSRMVRMTLAEDQTVEAVQVILRDTMETDTLRGTYVVTDSTIKVSLSGDTQHWNFKRAKFGNLTYMTTAGTIYKDEDGMTADLIRIFKPKKLTRKTESDSAETEKSDSTEMPKE